MKLYFLSLDQFSYTSVVSAKFKFCNFLFLLSVQNLFLISSNNMYKKYFVVIAFAVVVLRMLVVIATAVAIIVFGSQNICRFLSLDSKN